MSEKKAPPVFKMQTFTGELPVNDNGQQETIDELIKESEIDLTKPLPPPPVAMEIITENNSQILFSKGNFSIVTGAAKSRKSFLISMLMAAAVKNEYGNKFTCPTDGINLLFDTEQAPHKVQQAGKRICHLSGKQRPGNFKIYCLRKYDPAIRMEIIERILSTTQNLNFVAIDGIIDLDIDPILDAGQAQNIVQKL